MQNALIKKEKDLLKEWIEEFSKTDTKGLAKKLFPEHSQSLIKNLAEAAGNLQKNLNPKEFISISNVLSCIIELQNQAVSNADIIDYLSSLDTTLKNNFPETKNPDLLRFEDLLIHLTTMLKLQNEKDLLLEEKIYYLENTQINTKLKMAGAIKNIELLLKDIEPVLDNNVSVLIQGETGTGKEMTALSIYNNSTYSQGQFIALNCAAIPDDLMESELFGFKKGSFTDALSDKPGKIELADHGVLFLDEVNELSPKLQAKLLRVLQEKTVTRIGEAKSRKVDFKLICSSNQDLKTLVDQKKFREDLYYRINVYAINLPPLRQRPDDILPIANHFLKLKSKEFHKNIKGINQEAANLLQQYNWPGNIRELDNVITRAVLKCKGEFLTIHELDIYLTLPENYSITSLQEVEKNHILFVLEKNKNNLSQTAKDLGITRATLYNKIKEYEI